MLSITLSLPGGVESAMSIIDAARIDTRTFPAITEEERARLLALEKTSNEVNEVSNEIKKAISNLPEGFESPSHLAVVEADRWLTAAPALAELAQFKWHQPHITPTPEGGISFEWWWDKRKLTWLFEGGERLYLLSWGPDSFWRSSSFPLHDMEEGQLTDLNVGLKLFRWLRDR